jgi:hypothetical protein
MYRPLWFWDAVLFDRRYYIYWGPVPALFLLGFKVITRHVGVIADQWPMLAFMLGRLYAGAALILSLAKTMRERPPYWAVALAIVVFGVASPTPFVIARPHVYEASIAAGQCFLFWGLVAAFWGLIQRRAQTLLFVAAGALWALGMGSRATLIAVVPLLVLITGIFAWRRAGSAIGPGFRALLALGVPVALGLVACAAYNYVRFGSVGEFGVNYQLTGRQFKGQNNYILPNLASYLFAELEWSCRFPFAKLPMIRNLWSWITWPVDYDVGAYDFGERVGGFLVTTSWCWMLGLGIWPLGQRLWRMVRREPQPSNLRFSDLALWLILCSFAAVVSIAPALRGFMGCMRYLEDAIGGLLIVSTMAGFWMLARSRASGPVWSALARVVYVALAVHSVFVGICLGFSGHIDNFRRSNPDLYGRLVDKYSVCPAP